MPIDIASGDAVRPFLSRPPLYYIRTERLLVFRFVFSSSGLLMMLHVKFFLILLSPVSSARLRSCRRAAGSHIISFFPNSLSLPFLVPGIFLPPTQYNDFAPLKFRSYLDIAILCGSFLSDSLIMRTARPFFFAAEVSLRLCGEDAVRTWPYLPRFEGDTFDFYVPFSSRPSVRRCGFYVGNDCSFLTRFTASITFTGHALPRPKRRRHRFFPFLPPAADFFFGPQVFSTPA